MKKILTTPTDYILFTEGLNSETEQYGIYFYCFFKGDHVKIILDGDVHPIDVFDSKVGIAEGISLRKHIKNQIQYSINQFRKVKSLL